MYEVSRYERSNLAGTAVLFELLTKSTARRVSRVVVASSRSIYGEGAYRCELDGLVYPSARSSEDKRGGSFDPLCPICSLPCTPVPTPESAPLQPASFYGLTKQVQEQMVLMFGEVLGISSFSLRYQNVYGPGQSLSNPYTGILAVFSNLARTGRTIQVFEDGLESRDFVVVNDVVRATAAAALVQARGCHAINVGSGVRTTVQEVAAEICRFFESSSPVETTGAFREGDIRHGIADLSLAGKLLGYAPTCDFRKGLHKFLEWAAGSDPAVGGYEDSLHEMRSRGLLHGKS
jgi:dTDP-L-rhamnose 4-epimerase